ncbi:tyrosine-type recombinase/integrase [Micromonospora sp. NPDC003776]
MIYAAALLDRLVGRSPVVRVSLPSSHRERIVPLTVDQVRALADVIPARNRAMVVTQAGLGLRLGELLALRVQDVDFASRLVRIEWQFAPQSKVRTEPKTPRSRRTVPLPQVVADTLRAHMAHFPSADDGTIFTTRFAGPYRHNYYGTLIFGAAVREAGRPERSQGQISGVSEPSSGEQGGPVDRVHFLPLGLGEPDLG